MKKLLLLALSLAVASASPRVPGLNLPGPILAAQQRPVITHLLFVTMDGMRWQELFGGMAAALLTKKEGGVSDPTPTEKRFGGARRLN